MVQMKLALHIGTEKTGTTLLQEWLYHNRGRLSRQGYALSDLIGKPCNRNIVSYFRKDPDDFWNRFNIRSEAEKARFFANFLEDFTAEMEAAAQTHHTVIITSEHFHSRLHVAEDLAAFAEFCKHTFDEIRVICYLRPQWAVRTSLYSTALKTNSTVPLDEFDANLTPDSHYYNYYDLYHRWGANFGFENLEFRLYDRENFAQGDLRQDFIDAIGGPIDSQALDFSISSANESVQLLMAHALIGVNRALPLFSEGGLDKRNHIYKSIVSQISALNTGTIADDRALELVEMFRESNNLLAREVFGREELFSPPEMQEVQEETYTAQEVATIIEKLVFTMARRTAQRGLFDADADLLRDVALKFETGEPISKAQAVALMTHAVRARPQGKQIQEKLQTWLDEA